MSVERSPGGEPPHHPSKLAVILAGTLLCVVILIIGGMAGVSAAVLVPAAGVWTATCGLLAAWKP